MKLTLATVALLSTAQAITNSDDGGAEVAQWIPGNDIYKTRNDKKCDTSDQCTEGYTCADHMWEYNGQQESARGCWDQSVCNDNGARGAYYMFDGRAIQFWCNDRPMEGTQYGELAYPFAVADAPFWPTWQETCKGHDECRMRNNNPNQHCTDFIWTATMDGKSWGNGSACYNWDENNCMNMESEGQQTFSVRNDNWEATQFSFHTQLWCTGPDFGFGTMPEAAGTTTTTEEPTVDEAPVDEAPQDAAKDEARDEPARDEGREGRDADDDRRGDSDMNMGNEGGSISMQMNDDGIFIEMRDGAAKLAATAVTAAVAASFF